MHETIVMELKIKVDKEIVPTINWLNSLDGTMTLYSCQGDENKDAYVSFECINPDSFRKIKKRLAEKVANGYFPQTLETDYEVPNHYVIRWGNIYCLRWWQEGLEENCFLEREWFHC